MFNYTKINFLNKYKWIVIVLIFGFGMNISFAQGPIINKNDSTIESRNPEISTKRVDSGKNKPEEKKEPKDWWDKAAVISQFFAGVIIAIVGLRITYVIQRTQIKVAEQNSRAQIQSEELRAKEDRRLSQGQLTGQLVQHLTSESEKVREIAIIALRESVPSAIYESVIQIIAKNDESQTVRETAIKQLGVSGNENTSKTLGEIAFDKTKSISERQIASEAASKIAFHSNIPIGTLVLTSSNTYETTYQLNELKGSPFTYFLIKGLKGAADFDENGIISGNELRDYVFDNSKSYTLENNLPYSQPSYFFDGINQEIPIISKTSPYNEVVGLIIGIDIVNLQNFSLLQYSVSGASELYEVFKNSHKFTNNLKLMANSTRVDILKNLDDIINNASENSLFIFYFSGHSILDQSGELGFMASDSKNKSDYLSVRLINSIIKKSKSKVKALFIDTSYSGIIRGEM